MSDHGVFRRNNVPYLFFSCGRWEHYHRVSDTPEKLNYDKMARITRLSSDILDRVANDSLSGSSNDDHTLEFEIKKLTEAMGLAMPLVKQHLGISELNSRAELKKIIDAVLSLGV